jgi:hypothetical protein
MKEKMIYEKDLTKTQIRKIAKEYGFWVEFSAMYDTFPTTIFGRIDDEEGDAYFSGEARDKNGVQIDLICGEDDRFEKAEHAHRYFKHLRDKFWDAYPEFKNHKPKDDWGKMWREWKKEKQSKAQ